MSKKTAVALLISFVCIVPRVVHSAVPNTINLQGRLTDPKGNPITTITQVDFDLYQGGSPDKADDGVVVYKERAVISPGPDGTYQHLIGSGTPLEGFALTLADFDTDKDVFLQLNIAGVALLPRIKMVSNPYSFLAGKAQDIEDGTISLPKLQPQVSNYLVPQGIIAMFASSCPQGWTRFGDMDGRFVTGVPSYTGVAGGSAQISGLTTSHEGAHSHTVESHTHGVGTLVTQGATDTTCELGSGGSGWFPSANGHTHVLSGNTAAASPKTDIQGDHVHTISSDGSWRPPYLGLVFCQKD